VAAAGAGQAGRRNSVLRGEKKGGRQTRQPDAEGAEVTQKTQKEVSKESLFHRLFFCDSCVTSAFSASGDWPFLQDKKGGTRPPFRY
jgi:hypothetical protein